MISLCATDKAVGKMRIAIGRIDLQRVLNSAPSALRRVLRGFRGFASASSSGSNSHPTNKVSQLTPAFGRMRIEAAQILHIAARCEAVLGGDRTHEESHGA